MPTNPLLDQIWVGGEYDPYKTKYTETPADEILQYIIDSINIWNTENPNPVTYHISECPTKKITIELNYESHSKWISEIAKTCTYKDLYYGTNTSDWWIDDNYGVHIKNIKEINYPKTSPYDISAKLLSLTKTESHNISNRLFGLGNDTNTTQLKITVQDNASIDTYGFRDEVISDQRFSIEENFRNYLKSLLRTKKDPVYSYDCTIKYSDFYDIRLQTGDWLRINQPEWNVNNVVVRILEYSTNFDTVTLTVSNSSYSVEEKINSINSQIEDISKYSQSTNKVGLAENRPTSGAYKGQQYFATDTFVLSIWTGIAWKTTTLV